MQHFKISSSEEVASSSPENLPGNDGRRPVLSPGRNCWKVAHAGRAGVLIDGAEYFRNLEAALRQARRSILIVGWDFDARIRLRQDESTEVSPPLGQLLRTLVEAEPDLHIHILIWSVSVVHGPSAPMPMLLGADWEQHPRIRLKLDTRHPLYCAHHQKIVCIDGKLAFVGGMDLTVRRWDTSRHAMGDRHRIDLDGSEYTPVHDLQMILDGEAAEAVCQLASDRWRADTGEEIPQAGKGASDGIDIWPSGLEPTFVDVDAGVARTCPAYLRGPEIAEIATLTIDAIAAARRSIYIEAQYLTAKSVGDALERQLQERSGPEVVIVMTHESKGLIERFAMAGNRDRLIRRLVRADRFSRLRVMYPVVPGPGGEHQVLVHAKLMIIDDVLMRIGSSNLNNRSMGLDTECDIAVEAQDEADRLAIAATRTRLLCEHLDCTAEACETALRETGSLLETIDRLNIKARGLRPFEAMSDEGPSRPILGTALLDPVRPFSLSRRLLKPLRGLLGRRGSATDEKLGSAKQKRAET